MNKTVIKAKTSGSEDIEHIELDKNDLNTTEKGPKEETKKTVKNR